MIRFREDFPDLLAGFSLATLEADAGTIYGLSADLALNYFNPAWFAFSSENGGEPAITERFPVGTYIGDAITGAAREYYLAAFQAALTKEEPWSHVYECSTPHIYRAYHQTVYRLRNGNGLIVVNSLIDEHPHEPPRKHKEPIPSVYTQNTGLINQCSNCRRVQRVSPPDVWDWVPVWVEHVPNNTSHTFCRVCFDYFYLSSKPKK